MGDSNFEGTDRFSCMNLEKDENIFIAFYEKAMFLQIRMLWLLRFIFFFFLWTFKSNLKLKANQTFLLF